MITSPRRTALAALALMAALSGCGFAQTQSPPPGSQSVPTWSSTPDLHGAAAQMYALGTRMMAAKSVRFVQLSPVRVLGEFVADGSQTDYSIAVFGPTGRRQIAVRVVQGSVYVALPDRASRGRFKQLPSGSRGTVGLLDSLTNLWPGQALQTVAPAVESVRNAGSTTIAGHHVRHYVFRINALKAHELLNPNVAIPKALRKRLKKAYDYDVFVDAKGLVRQVRLTVLGRVTLIRYNDWGAKIRVAAPTGSSLMPSTP